MGRKINDCLLVLEHTALRLLDALEVNVLPHQCTNNTQGPYSRSGNKQVHLCVAVRPLNGKTSVTTDWIGQLHHDIQQGCTS